jgi:hypothetical protein
MSFCSSLEGRLTCGLYRKPRWEGVPPSWAQFPSWMGLSSRAARDRCLRGGPPLKYLDARERCAPDQVEVPQGALDVHSFFNHSTLEHKLRIIQRREVDYVMVPAGSPVDATLKSQPAFSGMDTLGEVQPLRGEPY